MYRRASMPSVLDVLPTRAFVRESRGLQRYGCLRMRTRRIITVSVMICASSTMPSSPRHRLIGSTPLWRELPFVPKIPLIARRTRNCPTVPAAITTAPLTTGDTFGCQIVVADVARTAGSCGVPIDVPQRRQKLSPASEPKPHEGQKEVFIAATS